LRPELGGACSGPSYRSLQHGLVRLALAKPRGRWAEASLLWVRELGRCHKKEPQAVYACLGFGGVCCTRLLTGQQGASGDGGCCPVGQCASDEDFLLGILLHLGMRRSARLAAGGDRASFAPQDFPSRAPLVPYWGAHNSPERGKAQRAAPPAYNRIAENWHRLWHRVIRD
jgi:hypothetical protein